MSSLGLKTPDRGIIKIPAAHCYGWDRLAWLGAVSAYPVHQESANYDSRVFPAQRLRSASLARPCEDLHPMARLLQNAARRSRREMRLISARSTGAGNHRFFRDERGERTARSTAAAAAVEASRAELDLRSRAQYLRSRACARERAFADAMRLRQPHACVHASIYIYTCIHT